MRLSPWRKSAFKMLLLGATVGAPSRAPHAAAPVSMQVVIDAPHQEELGTRINRAVAQLGPRQGTIYVSAEGTLSTTVRLGVGHALQFGPGRWVCAAAPCITLDNASQVIGAGIYRTRLQMDRGLAGPLVQSAGYPELSGLSEHEAMGRDNSLAGDRKSLPGVKYVLIRDLTLDGQSHQQVARGNGIEIYGFWFNVEDISVERFTGDGLVTHFIPGHGVPANGNDTMESHFTRIKLISNGGNGWTFRGPHDSIVSGLIAANNGGWGIDVLHREGYYSGGGLMLSNTHLYGNENGLRTETGANILAFGLECEANRGVGLLLRSNDSVVHGTFYANATYGVQMGDEEFHAAANTLTLQAHNNGMAQIYWRKSGGYNMVTGSIFPNDDTQKYFESHPSVHDHVLTAGPKAVPPTPDEGFFDKLRGLFRGKPNG